MFCYWRSCTGTNTGFAPCPQRGKTLHTRQATVAAANPAPAQECTHTAGAVGSHRVSMLWAFLCSKIPQIAVFFSSTTQCSCCSNGCKTTWIVEVVKALRSFGGFLLIGKQLFLQLSYTCIYTLCFLVVKQSLFLEFLLGKMLLMSSK